MAGSAGSEFAEGFGGDVAGDGEEDDDGCEGGEPGRGKGWEGGQAEVEGFADEAVEDDGENEQRERVVTEGFEGVAAEEREEHPGAAAAGAVKAGKFVKDAGRQPGGLAGGRQANRRGDEEDAAEGGAGEGMVGGEGVQGRSFGFIQGFYSGIYSAGFVQRTDDIEDPERVRGWFVFIGLIAKAEALAYLEARRDNGKSKRRFPSGMTKERGMTKRRGNDKRTGNDKEKGE